LHNNYEAAEILLSYPSEDSQIDWRFKDQTGRNIVARCVQCFESYSYENDSLLRLLIQKAGKLAKKLLNDRDNEGNSIHFFSHAISPFMISDIVSLPGKRPIDHAAEHSTKVLYNVLIDLGSPASEITSESTEMDLEFEYHQMPVEKDASEARQLLLEQAEAERIRKGEDVTEEKAKVDPLSQLEDVGEVVVHNGEPLDIIIHKTDVLSSQWGVNM
jgi:hypothetical protein